MARSKSPDNFLERCKAREKSPLLNNLALNSFKSQEKKLTKLYLNSQGNRINSISNLQSSKKLHRKISAPKIKSALNKSPSSPISVKNELQNSLSVKSALNLDDSKRIEIIFKKIEEFDKKYQPINSSSDFIPFKQKFELINSLFFELIESDKQFSKYLILIKKFYEEYYEKKASEEIIDLKNEIKASNKQVEKLQQEKMTLERTLDKLSKENLSISKDLEDSEKFNHHLQEKLSLLHTFNIDRIPLNKETWKCLVLENNYFSDMCKNLKNELRGLKYNEQILMDKLEKLREKGIDVQMILKEVQREKGFESSSEPEGIVSGRVTSPTKPNFIPDLDIDGLNSGGSSNNDSDF